MTKIKCIHCKSEEVVKNGKRKTGVQCLKRKSCWKSFQGSYKNNGPKPETKKIVVKMSVNGSGIRDILRVLVISQSTVIAIKKRSAKRELKWGGIVNKGK